MAGLGYTLATGFSLAEFSRTLLELVATRCGTDEILYKNFDLSFCYRSEALVIEEDTKEMRYGWCCASFYYLFFTGFLYSC